MAQGNVQLLFVLPDPVDNIFPNFSRMGRIREQAEISSVAAVRKYLNVYGERKSENLERFPTFRYKMVVILKGRFG